MVRLTSLAACLRPDSVICLVLILFIATSAPFLTSFIGIKSERVTGFL